MPAAPGAGRRGARPLLLVAAVGPRPVVARCCAAAQEAGVCPGMSLAEARALCPAAQAAAYDPERSRQALETLAHWATRFSPTVAVDPTPRMVEGLTPRAGGAAPAAPDGLLLDITGEAHLFGGEPLLLHEMASRLEQIGFSARLAAAPTVGAAWAAARFGPHPLCVIPEDRVAEALRPLPLAALRLEAGAIENLQRVGVVRIEQLLALPREALLNRFGVELLVRLDQAFGRVEERFEPVRRAEPLALRRVFEGATTQLEAVLLAAQGLVEAVARRLAEREQGARGLRLELARINAPAASREILLGRPSREARHLWALLRPKAEGMHLGYGVEAVTLTAFWTETIAHAQLNVFGGQEAADEDRQVAALLDTLTNRWGRDRVLRVCPRASHTPELAQRYRPVFEAAGKAEAPEAALLFADRPSLLLERPEPAEATALQPDHPPSVLWWRGQEHTCTAGEGPERIVTAWWGGKPSRTRDYYKVRNFQGMWLWVFREAETGQWFVHGLWV